MIENVAKFEELLRTDESARIRLQELFNSYTGDKTDEKTMMEATVGKLAEEVGLPFTYEEGKAELYKNGGKMSDDDLDAVAGGKGGCIIVGGSGGPDASYEGAFSYACCGIGVGVGGSDD